MTFGIIMLLILALLLVVFTIQNTHMVDVNILFWTLHQIPLALVIFSCIVGGALICMGIYLPRIWKKRAQINKLNKEMANIKELIQSSVNQQAKQMAEQKKIEDAELTGDTPSFLE